MFIIATSDIITGPRNRDISFAYLVFQSGSQAQLNSMVSLTIFLLLGSSGPLSRQYQASFYSYLYFPLTSEVMVNTLCPEVWEVGQGQAKPSSLLQSSQEFHRTRQFRYIETWAPEGKAS